MQKVFLIMLLCSFSIILLSQNAESIKDTNVKYVTPAQLGGILNSRIAASKTFRARGEFETVEEYQRLKNENEKFKVDEANQKMEFNNNSNKGKVFRLNNLKINNDLRYDINNKRFYPIGETLIEPWTIKEPGFRGNFKSNNLSGGLTEGRELNNMGYLGFAIYIVLPPKEAEAFKARFIKEGPIVASLDFTYSYRSSGYVDLLVIGYQLINRNGQAIYIDDSNGARIIESSKILDPILKSGTDTFKDARDGRAYKWVLIGNQIWMASNLNFKAPGSKTYNNSESNGSIYGRLYNWETAKKSCPSGWHLPTEAEWMTLIDYLGGNGIAGSKMKEIGTTHWSIANTDASNKEGFTALPGGYLFLEQNFMDISKAGYWWTSTEGQYSLSAITMDLNPYNGFIGIKNGMDIKNGLSVRCIKDY
jgi:uncharacterized protein (TIGR02145 family)